MRKWFEENALALKGGAWGALLGAILMVAVGFNWFGYGFGWTLGGTAEKMANQRAEAREVSVLAPICADRFVAEATPEQRADYAAKSERDWEQKQLIEAVVKFDGRGELGWALRNACAEQLKKLLASGQTAEN